MALNWTSLRDACRNAAKAVWPEVTTPGVWPVDRIERVPLEDIDLPFAAVLYGSAQMTPEWGITNQSYLLDVTFFYVFRISTSTEYPEVAAAKGEAMEDYLLTTGLAPVQVIDVTAQEASQDSPLNALILEKQKPYWSVGVTAQILVGETNA